MWIILSLDGHPKTASLTAALKRIIPVSCASSGATCPWSSCRRRRMWRPHPTCRCASARCEAAARTECRRPGRTRSKCQGYPASYSCSMVCLDRGQFISSISYSSLLFNQVLLVSMLSELHWKISLQISNWSFKLRPCLSRMFCAPVGTEVPDGVPRLVAEVTRHHVFRCLLSSVLHHPFSPLLFHTPGVWVLFSSAEYEWFQIVGEMRFL